jgi:hypothetical protein
VIVTALIMGCQSIGFIAIILFIFFYIFAIIGLMLFRENDPWHFGSLHIALLTLFRCATLEDWTDVMYINYWGCEKYGYADMPERCRSRDEGVGHVSTVYFLIFIVIGALVLFTLFIGVVTTSMEEATEDMKTAQEVDKNVAEIQLAEGLSEDVIELYRTVFGMLDLDSGGTIEEEELRIGLQSIGRQIDEGEISEMLQEVDESGDGEIDFAEFLQFMLNIKKLNSGGAEEEEDEKEQERGDAPKLAPPGEGNGAAETNSREP